MPAIGVPGLPDGPPPEHPLLNQRRALAIANLLQKDGLAVRPLAASGQRFRLVLADIGPTAE